jgi:putative MATE family efflux protein
MKHHYDPHLLETENITKLLLKFSLPATIGVLMQTLYNLIDTIFIGHAVGALGIAALSIVFPVQIIFVGIAQINGIGCASLVSIALGEKNKNRAEFILGNAWSLSLISGIVMTIILSVFSDYILRLLGVTATILPYAKVYFNIIVLGAAFMMFYLVGINVIRAEGNPKAAMMIVLVSSIFNVILDIIFIFILHKGLYGAALASLITQILTAVYILYFFLSHKSSLAISLRYFVVEKTIALKIFGVGLSSFLRMATNSIILIILNRLLGIYGGDVAIAVYGILNRVMIFANLPVLGITEGLQPIIGYSYGAKLFKRLKKAVRLGSLAASSYSLLIFIVLLLFPGFIIRLFVSESNINLLGGHALHILAPALLSLGFQTVASGMFQSIGKIKPSLFLSLLRNVFLFIPLVFILASYYHLEGIWFSFPASYCGAFLITLAMFVWQMKQFEEKYEYNKFT